MKKYSREEWNARVHFSGVGGDKNTCAICGPNKTKMKKCGSCYVTRYCSRAHQKLDWPEHKLVCESIKNKFQQVTLTGSLVPVSGDSQICKICGKYKDYISDDVYLCMDCI